MLRFLLKASRPGLWFPTLWLYLLPLGGRPLPDTPLFWLGLIYASFPLNLLIYGWNDVVDAETDALNPRKDTYLFGARGTPEQLAALPAVIAGVTAPFWVIFGLVEGPEVLAVLAGIVAVTALYNLPRRGLRGEPPFELLCQGGYLLVVPLAAWLSDAPLPPWPTFLYLALFCAQSQLIGEVMDIDPDRAAGRRTTATVLGSGTTKLLIIAVVAAEVALVLGLYRDAVFGGMLALFLLWLLLDRFVVFRDKRYTVGQMKLLGLGSNVAALLSMAYAWWSACLLEIPG